MEGARDDGVGGGWWVVGGGWGGEDEDDDNDSRQGIRRAGEEKNGSDGSDPTRPDLGPNHCDAGRDGGGMVACAIQKSGDRIGVSISIGHLPDRDGWCELTGDE